MSRRRFLEVDDLTPTELAAVLDAAAKGKADPSGIPHLLAGQGVAMLFEKPSARTRASTEMAVVTLGGEGSVVSDGRRFWRVTLPPPIKVISTIGSGDSLAGGWREGGSGRG